MLRALLLGLVMLAAAGPARAAGDIDTCRNATAEPVARLAACESVIADDKITGPSRAAAFWYRGDSLMKKRDYDGAIAAFSASHEIAPQNVNVINARGIAYSYKGDEERALADYDLCLQLRPTYGSAYNNRGLIFMRRGELQRALDEFNLAVKYIFNDQSRYLHHYNRARLQGLMKRFDASLADYAEAQKVNPDGTQVPAYRCITYTSMGRFDDAIADCNTALAKSPTNVYGLTSRGNAYLGKGNLDAALDDYEQALKINPNYVRAYVGRGQLFEKRRNLAAARADYRMAANAVAARREDIDTTLARAVAKERLEALLGTAAPAPAGKVFTIDAATGRSAQGGADRRQRRLPERRAAGQPAAGRQTDCVDLSRTWLCHGNDGARSRPGQVLRHSARIRRRSRKGRLGGGLLCRPRHGDRRRELPDSGRRPAQGRQRRGNASRGAGAGDRSRGRREKVAPRDARRLPRQPV